jgi:hypothetical protein
MMILDIEKQYASPELCGHMVALGAPWESLICWDWAGLPTEATNYEPPRRYQIRGGVVNPGWYPLYSVPELLEMLPSWITLDKQEQGNGYEAMLRGARGFSKQAASAETAADALARLWLALHTPNPLTTDTEN